MIKKEFTQIDDKTGKQKVIKCEFENKEWEKLLSFLEYTKELRKTDIVQKGAPGGLKINYEKNKGMTYSVNLPPDDSILALIHRLRPFILKKEPTFFHNTSNVLKRRLSDEQIRVFITYLKDLFDGKFMQAVKISSNNQLINSEKILQKWLNGFEYHKDEGKRKEILNLHKLFPLDASRAIFVMMLYDKVRAIKGLGQFIQFINSEIEKFSIYI